MERKMVSVFNTDNNKYYMEVSEIDPYDGEHRRVKSLVLDSVAEVGVIIADTFSPPTYTVEYKPS